MITVDSMDFEKFLDENKIWHRFAEGRAKSAKEASETTGVPIENIIKTLAFEAGDEIYLVIAPAISRVSTKKLKKLLNLRDTKLASPEKVKEATGYEAGEVPPVGHKHKLRAFIDKKVLDLDVAWAGGGSLTRIVELNISDIMRFAEPLIADVTE